MCKREQVTRTLSRSLRNFVFLIVFILSCKSPLGPLYLQPFRVADLVICQAVLYAMGLSPINIFHRSRFVVPSSVGDPSRPDEHQIRP